MRALFTLLLLISCTVVQAGTVLFDAAHAETAGNADWVLDEDSISGTYTPARLPTPVASEINSSTVETYWTGAVSAWGVALVKLGHSVETLPAGGRLSYGDLTNAQDLSNYRVLVLPEPNVRFTADECTAIIRFVQDGGGVFLIADHAGSDRNNDGIDSVGIFNELFSSNGVAANPFGLTINSANLSLTSTYYDPDAADPLTNGLVGPATQLKYSGGASLTLSTAANSSVRAAFWTSSSHTSSTAMAAWGSFGSGRFVALGDSSPMDDGTGAPGNDLYYGWTELGANHSNLILNATLWLLAGGDAQLPPPNDAFNRATQLTPDATAAAGSNLNATHEVGEPPHAGFASAASVWWTITPAASGTATISTAGSNFDTLLAIYTGSSVGALTPVASNDNDGNLTTSSVTFAVTAGTTYRIAVDGRNEDTGAIALQLSLPLPPPPANDNFASAAVVTFSGSGTTLTGTNIRASVEIGEPQHAGYAGGRSVWWIWTPAANYSATVSTAGSSFDTLLAVYTGTSVSALAAVASNANYGSTLQSQVTFNAVAGTTYRIAVDGYSAASGTVQLAFNLVNSNGVPLNDAFANATLLAGSSVTSATINTAQATKESGEPNHAGNSGGHSIWWTWTAPATADVQFDTIGSSFDTTLGVYVGNAVNALTTIGSNDDGGGNATSKVIIKASAGVRYSIAVDGYGSATGNVVLHLLMSTPPPPANDNFANASALSGLGVTSSVSTAYATRESGEPNHAGNPGGHSVWWSYTPIAAGTLTITTAGSTFDTLLAVYTGSSVAALTTVAENDNDGNATTSQVSFAASAGVTYRMAIDGSGGSVGVAALAVSLAVPVPSNDLFANATTLTGENVTATGDNFSATKEPGEPTVGFYSSAHTVWWKWTPAVDQFVKISTLGSDFSHSLGVFTGSAVDALVPVIANYGNFSLSVSFSAHAGQAYYIQLDGYSGVGHIVLNLARQPFISLAATTATAAERGSVPGVFTVTLDAVQPVPLLVNLYLSGSASQSDYTAAPAPNPANDVTLTIPAGATQASLIVTPLADNDPSEGPENVWASLSYNVAYNFDPLASSAAITITDDSPYSEEWSYLQRVNGITGTAAAPGADPDGHGIPNLLRYAFDLDVVNPSLSGLPQPGSARFADPADNNKLHTFPTLTYRRRKDAATTLQYFAEEAVALQNMSSWNASTPVVVSVVSGPTANTESVTVRAGHPANGPAAVSQDFLRVRVATP